MKFAAEVSAREHVFICPTCNAKHDDSILTFIHLAEDGRELSSLKLELEAGLEGIKERLVRNQRKAVELRTEYGRLQELLAVKRGKFTFEDFIRSYSANTADDQLAVEARQVERELSDVAKELGNIRVELRGLAKEHDGKTPLEAFRENFRRAAVELNVPTPEGIDKWAIDKRPTESGSRFARSLIAYYCALWRTVARDGEVPVPIVIDSPNQGAQDAKNLRRMLASLAGTAPSGAQVILTHEADPAEYQADLKVSMPEGRRLLTKEGFDKVAPALFRMSE